MKFFLAILLISCIQAEARLSASPSLVFFSNVQVGSLASRTVLIQNRSNQDVHVTTSDDCFGELSAINRCNYIRADSFCDITVQFRPRRAGSSSCNIRVNDRTGGSGYITISVRGQGVEYGR